MLILKRKPNERIVISTSDGDIELLVMDVRGKIVRLGIDAPRSVHVVRKELMKK